MFQDGETFRFGNYKAKYGDEPDNMRRLKARIEQVYKERAIAATMQLVGTGEVKRQELEGGVVALTVRLKEGA